MKILICVSELPPIAGGAQQIAWEATKKLAEFRDLEVHILSFGNKPNKLKENINFHYFPKNFLPTLYYSTIGLFTISKFLKKYKFDIIHSHMVLPFGYIFRNFKCKKIITAHGGDVYGSRLYEKYFIKIALKKADKIITVSKFFEDLLKKEWKISSIVIPNAVDTSLFKIKKIIKEKNSVLFVGRYIEMKGIKELLSVANSLPHYKFYFVGTGHLNHLIKGKNIVNLGFKHKEELVRLYNVCEIGVFPSYCESFGITALEAIACGCPVVVTPKGFSEFIEDEKEGLIIPKKDEVALKEAIIELMKNKKLRKQMSKNGIKKAKQYDWSKIIKQYYKLYFK